MYVCMNIRMYILIGDDRSMGRWTDRCIDKHTGRQTDRQMDSWMDG